VLEDIQTKFAKPYEKMTRKMEGRKKNEKRGKSHWKPKVKDEVLLRTQQVSDGVVGFTAKLLHPYERPYVTAKIIPQSTFQLAEENVRVRGQFNKRFLKAYKGQ